MFSKQKNDRKVNEISTLIGEGTSVEGSLNIESSIRIDGKVYGDIKSAGDVTIGKEGYVEKSIIARNLYIAGTMKGNAKVENKIHIFESGTLNGSAEMKSIVIDENAHFYGRSLMKGTNKNNVHKPKVVEIEREKEKEVIESTKEEYKEKEKDKAISE
ncbi:polymer-forming cytoskeletal protein [Evansella sp. AB-rgal1]|uniref:bactofilin family protein n=1 Tax=Evansella sp. AB-rgal1 TaxID=3242696 RepID=UPI00359EAD6F